MNEEQKQTFQARVERLNTRAQDIAANRPKRKDSLWHRLAYPGTFVGAFLLGVLTIFVSRYVLYQMVGIPGAPGQGNQDIISLICAGVIVLTMTAILKDKAKEAAAASTVGVVVGVSTYHNLVWEFPGFFTIIYGADWVDYVMKLTEPSSFFLFGITLSFG